MTTARRIMAVIGGLVAGLGIGGTMNVTLSTQQTYTGVPVVLSGTAFGLGVGMIVAALIRSKPRTPSGDS